MLIRFACAGAVVLAALTCCGCCDVAVRVGIQMPYMVATGSSVDRIVLCPREEFRYFVTRYGDDPDEWTHTRGGTTQDLDPEQQSYTYGPIAVPDLPVAYRVESTIHCSGDVFDDSAEASAVVLSSREGGVLRKAEGGPVLYAADVSDFDFSRRFVTTAIRITWKQFDSLTPTQQSRGFFRVWHRNIDGETDGEFEIPFSELTDGDGEQNFVIPEGEEFQFVGRYYFEVAGFDTSSLGNYSVWVEIDYKCPMLDE